MWSTPDALSVGLLKAFGNRSDCATVDEPFHAAYLAATGLADDNTYMRETDPDEVAASCRAEPRRQWSYQRHMPHHMLESFPLDWTEDVTNVFLIRHPRRLLASLTDGKLTIREADLGFRRMREIYHHVRLKTDLCPIVVDAEDIERDPKRGLTLLCEVLGMPFEGTMLSPLRGMMPVERRQERATWSSRLWPQQRRRNESGGVMPELPSQLLDVEREALPYYEAMAERRLRLS